MPRKQIRWGAVTMGILVLFVEAVVAHGGGLAGAQPERMVIPTWLFLLTGGGTIGASFLLASFVTDRVFLWSLHDWRVRLPTVTPTRVVRWGGRAVGVLSLLAVIGIGYFGPETALRNAGLLLVWAGWWAGYTMSVYLLGNSWPIINPFRTLTLPVSGSRLAYPEWLKMWPSVVGLLALIWFEIVSPIAENPHVLALAAVGYLGVTGVGVFLVGSETWFQCVDPVSSVFRQYGKVAPIQRTDDGITFKLPGTGLIADTPEDLSEVGFIIALVWGTTYDGFVQTPLWADIAPLIVERGIPPMVLYPLVLAGGYFAFLGIYLLASKYVRPLAPTYLSVETIARVFAPPLLAIAVGYHFAHYLSYFLTLSPALGAALLQPLNPPMPRSLVLPSWFSGLSIAFILLGHILAIWVAHSIAYEEFPKRLQAIRSQYSVTVVMVIYTMVSLWIVTRPYTQPPYL